VLSLIGREIRDHIVFVLAPCVVGLVVISLAIRSFMGDMGMSFVAPLIPMMSVCVFTYCVLGATQMYGDRTHKVSALLGTLAVTRNRILVARVLVGVLTILASLAPLVVTTVILLRLFVPEARFWYRMIGEVSATVALTGFACYCAGLLIGWTNSRAWLIAGNPLLLVVIVSLVYVKGFGPEVMVVLLVLIVAMLLRTWHKFTSASL